MQIKFKRDTAFRKTFFVPDSFAHPAKMDAQLLIWLTENYTNVGETILDPMAGSGTMMLACTLGRNCILVELEDKFCKMMADNWQEVKMRPQLGSQMGECQIIQGDARNLEGLLCDKIITSPPYAESVNAGKGSIDWDKAGRPDKAIPSPDKHHVGFGVGEFRYSDNPSNIGNLPYGDIDKIITSPPYAEAQEGSGLAKNPPATFRGVLRNFTQKQGDDIRNVSNLPYGNIDKIITSPPYDEGGGHGGEPTKCALEKRQSSMGQGTEHLYGVGSNNIGNLKGDTYLEAMSLVYSQCFTVLKDGGLMILVTKNFIRNRQIIRLDTDTIKLCEQVGFRFVERHYRKLPAQSFWRTIYQQKYPDVEVIENEDVLIFRK